MKARFTVNEAQDFVFTGASSHEVWPLVRDFHYSKRMPSAVKHCFACRGPGGLFGDTGELVAAIVYGNPVNRNWPQGILELQRLVRRDDFTGQLSEFIAWTLRWLNANKPAPLVLSYADSDQGHHGGIYQASNFIYVGAVESGHTGYRAEDGSFVHRRTCNAKFGTSGVKGVLRRKPNWTPIYGKPKHIYVWPMRQRPKAVLRRFGWTPQPFPKPNAARLVDAPVPAGASRECTPGAAPL